MAEVTEEQRQRYIAAGHRVQSGVKFMLSNLPHSDSYGSPKDLRTGLDLSKADMKGLVELLIAKGVFTLDEYIEAIIKSAEEEGDRFEADASEMLGQKVQFA